MSCPKGYKPLQTSKDSYLLQVQEQDGRKDLQQPAEGVVHDEDQISAGKAGFHHTEKKVSTLKSKDLTMVNTTH